MPVPVSESSGEKYSLVYVFIWIVPFIALYIWHIIHDHRHTNSLEKKLDEIIEILRSFKE